MKNIVMIGFKSSGKTTVGRILSARLGMSFYDLDDTIEALLSERYGAGVHTCRSFFREKGVERFRAVESDALQSHLDDDDVVLASGGGAPMRSENADIFKRLGIICYVRADVQLIYGRFVANGMPAYLEAVPEPERLAVLTEMWNERNSVYESLANLTATSTIGPAEEVADDLEARLKLRINNEPIGN